MREYVLYVPGETLDGYAYLQLLPNGVVNTTPFIKKSTTWRSMGKTYAIAKDFNTLTLVQQQITLRRGQGGLPQ